MKNLRKLTKKELKTVQGGIPMCLPGYYWCAFVKKCISVNVECGLA
ncbi:bacteriocin-like protein [Chryseobacterium phocaeense]|nr:bacteriocin [Chryseobacterium phocaeense]